MHAAAMSASSKPGDVPTNPVLLIVLQHGINGHAVDLDAVRAHTSNLAIVKGLAVELWDSHINAGTVTHQNIGYLFPLGPWYWILRTLGVPTWIAERLWFGTLFFLAGAGTLWMLRKLGQRGPGAAVAAFAYMLSPYVLSYMAACRSFSRLGARFLG